MMVLLSPAAETARRVAMLENDELRFELAQLGDDTESEWAKAVIAEDASRAC